MAKRPRKSTATRPEPAKTPISSLTTRNNVRTSNNDRLSAPLENLVPDEFKGTDRFLDVVQWNIEHWGGSKYKGDENARSALVTDILAALNADLFVFQEVIGPDNSGRNAGVLDDVADELGRRGAGNYTTAYTLAGGEQRVAMMWDRDWLRAKVDVAELFPRRTHVMNGGKDAFAERTPLYGYFEARGEGGRFDFQVLGVHLKAMEEGKPQRARSAEVLAEWLNGGAQAIDADAMIMGDWNAPPDDDCWAPIHALEVGAQPKIVFKAINDPQDFSYLWLRNRTNQAVSRIDLTAMTLSSSQQVADNVARVVRWTPIAELLGQGMQLSDSRLVQTMSQMKERISDHMPTVTRFYFTPPDP